MNETHRTKMKWVLALSMAIFGTIGPLKQLVTDASDVTSGEVALYRALMAVVWIGAYLLIRRERIDLRAVRRELLLLLCSGMVMGMNWVLLFQAYDHTSISLATLSYYFAPVLVTLICPLLFRERLTKKQILCFVMSTVGLVLIIGVGGSGADDGVGILFGLGAAVLYATVVLMNKYIRGVAGIQRTFLQFLGAIMILVPYVLCTGGMHLETLEPIGWGALLIIGLVHTGINYCLYFSTLKELDGQSVAILGYIDPLVAVLVSFALGETLRPLQMLGGAMILGFTLYNELGNRK